MLIWNPQRSAKYTLPSKNSVMAELPALTISLRNYLNMPLSQRVTFFTPCFSVCGKKVKYPLPGKMEQSYHCTRAKGPDRRVQLQADHTAICTGEGIRPRSALQDQASHVHLSPTTTIRLHSIPRYSCLLYTSPSPR